jgi:hypothetical protein
MNVETNLVVLVFLFMLLSPTLCFSEESLSVGYGFAFLSLNHRTGYIQGSKHYDFFQLTYDYEKGDRSQEPIGSRRAAGGLHQ